MSLRRGEFRFPLVRARRVDTGRTKNLSTSHNPRSYAGLNLWARLGSNQPAPRNAPDSGRLVSAALAGDFALARMVRSSVSGTLVDCSDGHRRDIGPWFPVPGTAASSAPTSVARTSASHAGSSQRNGKGHFQHATGRAS